MDEPHLTLTDVRWPSSRSITRPLSSSGGSGSRKPSLKTGTEPQRFVVPHILLPVRVPPAPAKPAYSVKYVGISEGQIGILSRRQELLGEVRSFGNGIGGLNVGRLPMDTGERIADPVAKFDKDFLGSLHATSNAGFAASVGVPQPELWDEWAVVDALGGWDGLRPFRHSDSTLRAVSRITRASSTELRTRVLQADEDEAQRLAVAEATKYPAVNGALLAPVSRASQSVAVVGDNGRPVLTTTVIQPLIPLGSVPHQTRSTGELVGTLKPLRKRSSKPRRKGVDLKTVKRSVSPGVTAILNRSPVNIRPQTHCQLTRPSSRQQLDTWLASPSSRGLNGGSVDPKLPSVQQRLDSVRSRVRLQSAHNKTAPSFGFGGPRVAYKSTHEPSTTAGNGEDVHDTSTFGETGSDLGSFMGDGGSAGTTELPLDSAADVLPVEVCTHAQKPNVSALTDGAAIALTGQSFARSPEARASVGGVSSWSTKH